MAAPRERIVAIDMLKGVAILWVMLIHAEALRGRFGMDAIVNHAVPIFVVLFGLNAELWWRRRPAAALPAWYLERARRLYVPVWAMLLVWWAIALWTEPPLIPLSWKLAVWHAIGALSYVGTGWFVTMILQLVVVFPLLHFTARRSGIGPVLIVCLAATVLSVTFRPQLVAWGGSDFARTFFPRFLGHVAAGMLFAHHLDWLQRPRAALGAMALVLPCWASHPGGMLPALGVYAERLVDPPLTLALLVAMRALSGLSWLVRPLVWLGVHSWGLYVGQMLVHNAFGLTLGYRAALARFDPAVYAAILLGGALALVWIGDAAMARMSSRQGTRSGSTSQR